MNQPNNQKIYKILVICGPTATGKSDFAVELARKIKGEIISADSRQVYRGMDIGTGKITKKEMRGVPHYGLSIVDPKRGVMNVSKFQKLARKYIVDITKRGKVPMLVGGTGFWIDAVSQNQNFPDVGPNKKLRAILANLSTPELFFKLQELDTERAKTIDLHNRHRIIRAIEIAEGLKEKSKSKKLRVKKTNSSATQKFIVDPLYIGLDLPQDELDTKIQARLDKRLKRGMIAEVQRLHKNGVSWKKLESFGLEYKFIALFLQNKLTKEDMRSQLFFSIRHYAKRQRTWFKRNKSIYWFNSFSIKITKSLAHKTKTLAMQFINK